MLVVSPWCRRGLWSQRRARLALTPQLTGRHRRRSCFFDLPAFSRAGRLAALFDWLLPSRRPPRRGCTAKALSTPRFGGQLATTRQSYEDAPIHPSARLPCVDAPRVGECGTPSTLGARAPRGRWPSTAARAATEGGSSPLDLSLSGGWQSPLTKLAKLLMFVSLVCSGTLASHLSALPACMHARARYSALVLPSAPRDRAKSPRRQRVRAGNQAARHPASSARSRSRKIHKQCLMSLSQPRSRSG